MVSRNVQHVEVVAVELNLRPLFDLEAHRGKGTRNLSHHPRRGVKTALWDGPAGERHVDTLPLDHFGEVGAPQFLFSLGEVFLQDGLGAVRRRAQPRSLLLRYRAETPEYLRQRPVPAQHGHAPLFETVQIGNGLQPLKGLVSRPFDHIGLWLHSRRKRP